MSSEESRTEKQKPEPDACRSVLEERKVYRYRQYRRAVISLGILIFVAWMLGRLDFNIYWIVGFIAFVFVWWKCKMLSILELVCKEADLEVHRERAFKNAETVEWLNFILNRWIVLSDESLLVLIKNSLDPLLEASLPPFIGSIEVSDFTLGTRTPYIKHIQAYDSFDDLQKLRATALGLREPPEDLTTRPKYKAVLDLDIGLVSPEARFVIRIKLGNKGLLGPQTDIAIEDFQISGKMQLVLSFNRHVAFPHLASLSFCFLHEPQVSFNIRMLKAVQLMEFPLVRQWISQLVNDTLKLAMVDPDRIYIPLCEDPEEAGRGAEFACGVLTLTIHGGMHGRPTEDPYWCVVSLGDQKINTKEVTSDGPWCDYVSLLIYNLHYDRLTIKVKGKRKLGTKYTVTQDVTPLARLYLDSNPSQEKTFEKENAKGGSLKLQMEYTPIPVVSLPTEEELEQAEDIQKTTVERLLPEPGEVSGVLLVCVHSGESMIPMDKNGLSDPYCMVYANRLLVKKTGVVKKSLDPVWNAMVEFPVANFTQMTLSFVLYDRDENALSVKDDSDDFLGSCNFKLTKDTPVVLRKHIDIMYKIKGSGMKKAGKLCFSIIFRPVATVRKSGKPEIPGGFPEGERVDQKSGKTDAKAMEALLMTERGAIQVILHRGRNLVAMDITGKSDPFVTLKVGDREKFRSRVQSKTLNPVWSETATIAMPAVDEKLHLDLWDKDALFQEKMGYLVFNSSTLKEFGKDPVARHWIRLNNTKSGELQLSFKFTPAEECNLDELNNNRDNITDGESAAVKLEEHEYAELNRSRKSGWKGMLKKRRVFGMSSRFNKKLSSTSTAPTITLDEPSHNSHDEQDNTIPRRRSAKLLNSREEVWLADDETESSGLTTGSEFHPLLLPLKGKSVSAGKRNRGKLRTVVNSVRSLKCNMSGLSGDESDFSYSAQGEDFENVDGRSVGSSTKKFSSQWKMKAARRKLRSSWKGKKQRSVSESEIAAMADESRDVFEAWFDSGDGVHNGKSRDKRKARKSDSGLGPRPFTPSTRRQAGAQGKPQQVKASPVLRLS